MDFIDKTIQWLDAPRMVGFAFAMGTLLYLFTITTRHHREFWEGVKGEDGKLQFIEAVLTVWLVLFTVMIVADFTLGLVASDKAWWSMDSVFLFGVSGRIAKDRFGPIKQPLQKEDQPPQ